MACVLGWYYRQPLPYSHEYQWLPYVPTDLLGPLVRTPPRTIYLNIHIESLTIGILKLFFGRLKKLFCIFACYSTLRLCRWLKAFLFENKELFIVYFQHHGCWCPGDVRSPDISSYGKDLVLPESFDCSTRKVKPLGIFFPENNYLW